MLRSISLLLVLLVLGPWSALGAAQGFGFNDMNEASAKLYSRVDGDDVQVAIRIEISDTYHLYGHELGSPTAIGKPTIVNVEAGGVQFGDVWFPEPHKFDQATGSDGKPTFILGYDHEVVLYVRGTLTAETAGDVSATLSGLTCEEVNGTCIPYDEDVRSKGAGPDELFAAFPAELSAEPGATGATEPSTSAATEVARTDVDYDAWEFDDFEPREGLAGTTGGGPKRGLFMWLLLAFVAGAILNVMPCVLPVISIKVLSFVQQAGEDKRRVFHLGVAFAAGILVVFWALAGVAIAAGMSWGEQFQSSGFLIAMIGVVFAFALSMFGVFELGVPAGVGQLSASRREGLGDAFFKGMLATALATPCSGPFLGSTLTWTLSQPGLIVFAIFTALGFGMAIPYVILTANPALLKKLPKPGPWMDTFKQAMGFVLIATVLYLMISLRQDLLLFTLFFLLFVGLACWWYGRFATFDKSQGRRLAHLGVAFVVAGLGARIAFAEMPRLFSEDGDAWERFEPDAFEQYLAEGRSVFVDFTADWCPNCKFNKVTAFDDEEVRAVMREKGVVALEADMTHDSPYTSMLERLRNDLGSRSIPFLAVFPGGEPSAPIIERDVVTKATMLEIFESLPDQS